MPIGHGPVQRVAHRGIPAEKTENTLASFLLAIELGADAIELDTHATRDGVIVVNHDESANGHVIAESSWSDIGRVRLPGNERVPMLADVLHAVGERATVYIEIKGVGIERLVIDTAVEHGKQFAVHSFDHATIARAAAYAPQVPRGFLLDRGTRTPVSAMLETARRLAARDVWPHWSLADEIFTRAARKAGLNTIVWTVNTREKAKELVRYGVSGICTDDVRILT